MNDTYTCYLSLGANLGNRGETLREALRRIAALPDVKLTAVAPFYETPPWGKTDQPPFLNTAAAVDVNRDPYAFLHDCQQIERDLGRVRHEHWGARTIDIDLLTIPGFTSDTAELHLPHPYLAQRAFVLKPLADIAPDLTVNGRKVREWLADVSAEGITRAAEVSDPYPLKLIACTDEARGIGYRGNLLAYIPEDLHRFRRLTEGHVVIMGRKTMASLPGKRPLVNRRNIVLSRTLTSGEHNGFIVVKDLPALWRELGRLELAGEREFWCIGGESVYRLLLPYVRFCELTVIPGTHEADAFLPPLDGFDCISSESFSASLPVSVPTAPESLQDTLTCRFEHWERRL